MKISSPNYTQIPNVFFDHWMRELSPYSFVVLMCLSRKLFGWHKTSDRISKNQICKITGLSKNQVQKSIQELEEHGLIVKHQQKNEYGNQPNTYSLDIEKPIDDMYDDQNLGGGGSQYDLGVSQYDPGGRSQYDPTKEKKYKRNTYKRNRREYARPRAF
ncbi:winged helix-turn-helix transcriptional regulator [bacterium]|nr:winged helix-turn-helix transcriptional regulator [bacterium]